MNIFNFIAEITEHTDLGKFLESRIGKDKDCSKNLLSMLKSMLLPEDQKRDRASAEKLLNHTFIRQGKQLLESERRLYNKVHLLLLHT